MKKIIIKGKKKKGKSILVLTGVHGNELTPIHCGMLLSEFKFKKLKDNFKKITILNAINVDGVKKNIREIPHDSTSDLNRMFSTEEDINIIGFLNEEFQNHDVIIDVHSSPRCKETVLINQNEFANSYVDFMKSINEDYLIRFSSNNTIKKYCMDLGKISFTIELNKMGEIDLESSHKGLALLLKLIENCDNIKIEKEEPKYEPFFEFTTYKEGLFIPYRKLGDMIKTGDKLGYVLDLNTFEKSEIIYNKQDAKLLIFNEIQYCNGNTPICYLQC